VIDLNAAALEAMRCRREMATIPGAARRWFLQHLVEAT